MIRSRLATPLQVVRSFWSCTTLHKAEDKRMMLKSMPKQDEGSQGERSLEIDTTGYHKICEFPSLETNGQLFDKISFDQLPIVHIRATRNNTLFQLTNHDGTPIYNRSCGVDGFKNCRKGTNIAAQISASAFGKKIIQMGYKTCRVCINGLGAGRMSSFKGLQSVGLNIISITDTTPIFEFPHKRPPAAKSL